MSNLKAKMYAELSDDRKEVHIYIRSERELTASEVDKCLKLISENSDQIIQKPSVDFKKKTTYSN